MELYSCACEHKEGCEELRSWWIQGEQICSTMVLLREKEMLGLEHYPSTQNSKFLRPVEMEMDGARGREGQQDPLR